jgi:hypothetical protein
VRKMKSRTLVANVGPFSSYEGLESEAYPLVHFGDGEGVLLGAFHDLLSRQGRLDAQLGLNVGHEGLGVANKLPIGCEHKRTGSRLKAVGIAHLDVSRTQTFSANSAQSSGYFITVFTVVLRACASTACPSASHYLLGPPFTSASSDESDFPTMIYEVIITTSELL